MGRKAIAAPVQDKPAIDVELVMGNYDAAVRVELEAKENVHALARELAYEGALTVGGLEDEIRFYQQRSVEAVLEMGKRLLLLKEVTGHGNFELRLDALGIGHTLAKRVMTATLKFSKGASTHLLNLPNLNQTKLFELLVLDEGEIEALSNGETIRGLNLDDVECMSVSELRVAMRRYRREREDEKAAQKEILRRRDERLNKQEEEISRLRTTFERAPELLEEGHLKAMADHHLMILREIELGLRSHFAKIERLFPDGIVPNHVKLAEQQSLSQVIQAARVLAGDFGVSLPIEDNSIQQLAWLTHSEAVFGPSLAAPAQPSWTDGLPKKDGA